MKIKSNNNNLLLIIAIKLFTYLTSHVTFKWDLCGPICTKQYRTATKNASAYFMPSFRISASNI